MLVPCACALIDFLILNFFILAKMCPRAKIEQKHTYNNTVQLLSGIFKANVNISNNNISDKICYFSRPYYPIQGVEDNQRIGRKITSTSLVIEGFINLFNYSPSAQDALSAFEVFNDWVNETSVTQPLNEETVNQFKVGIRQFVVEVDTEFVLGLTDEQIRRKFLSWFHELSVYVDIGSQVSNSTLVKRESTSYTGQFKILMDKHYILSQKSPQVHFQHTINYKRDLNFDGTGSSLPTNKVVFLVTIGPSNIDMDYYNYGFGRYMITNSGDLPASTEDFRVAYCTSNIKLNYLDL